MTAASAVGARSGALNRGRRRVPVKGAKFGVSSIVAIGVLVGSAVAVGAQESESPTEFEGRWEFSYTVESRGDAGGTWGYVTREMSDPRLDGSVSITGNESVLSNGTDIWSSAFRIENDQGSWQEVPWLLMDFGDDSTTTRTGLFMGEGAYEGLVAVAELAWDRSGMDSAFDVRGIVLDADDLPPTVAEPAP
jgi:hypothetical protein